MSRACYQTVTRRVSYTQVSLIIAHTSLYDVVVAVDSQRLLLHLLLYFHCTIYRYSKLQVDIFKICIKLQTILNKLVLLILLYFSLALHLFGLATDIIIIQNNNSCIKEIYLLSSDNTGKILLKVLKYKVFFAILLPSDTFYNFYIGNVRWKFILGGIPFV